MFDYLCTCHRLVSCIHHRRHTAAKHDSLKMNGMLQIHNNCSALISDRDATPTKKMLVSEENTESDFQLDMNKNVASAWSRNEDEMCSKSKRFYSMQTYEVSFVGTKKPHRRKSSIVHPPPWNRIIHTILFALPAAPRFCCFVVYKEHNVLWPRVCVFLESHEMK